MIIVNYLTYILQISNYTSNTRFRIDKMKMISQFLSRETNSENEEKLEIQKEIEYTFRK